MATAVERNNNYNDTDDASSKTNVVPTLYVKFESSTSSSLSQRPRSGSEPRRIIKAAKVKDGDNHNNNNINDHDNGNDDDDDDDNNKNVLVHKKKKSNTNSSSSSSSTTRTEHIPLPIAESPSVAREQVQETYEHFKEDRRHTMAERQKATREHKRKERRTSSSSSSAPAAVPAVSANPMSRFLSIFSVEPLYPWHKRSYEKATDDLMDEPSEKRLRPSAAEAATVEGDGATTMTTTTMTKDPNRPEDTSREPAEPPSSLSQGWTSTHLLTAVTVVAVAVLVAWRWSSRRR